jgi:putative peptidoglycan lipid II flippase
MVSLAGLDYGELGRCLLTAVASGAAVWAVFGWLLGVAVRALGMQASLESRWGELALLLVGSTVWCVATDWILRKTGSALPRVLRKRLKLA